MKELRKICPHCGEKFARPLDRAIASSHISGSTVYYFPDKYASDPIFLGYNGEIVYKLYGYRCPKCDNLVVDLAQFDKAEINKDPISVLSILPIGKERPVPKEVPDQIASDYKEATKIMDISLKGSATLARRCLQATLRNAFPEMPRNNLKPEMDWINANTDLDQTIKDYLGYLKDVGNFGAHPSKTDGLSEIYELSSEDLDACFELLDLLFDSIYVQPAKKKMKLEGLKDRLSTIKK